MSSILQWYWPKSRTLIVASCHRAAVEALKEKLCRIIKVYLAIQWQEYSIALSRFCKCMVDGVENSGSLLFLLFSSFLNLSRRVACGHSHLSHFFTCSSWTGQVSAPSPVLLSLIVLCNCVFRFIPFDMKNGWNLQSSKKTMEHSHHWIISRSQYETVISFSNGPSLWIALSITTVSSSCSAVSTDPSCQRLFFPVRSVYRETQAS
jgi:hypothetical protein